MDVKTLDFYIDRALAFFDKAGDYTLQLPDSKMTFVTGSQNGYHTGRVLYRFSGRPFVHDPEKLALTPGRMEPLVKSHAIDDVSIVTASGSREAIDIADYVFRLNEIDPNLKVNAVVCKRGSSIEKKYGDRIRLVSVDGMDAAPEEAQTINAATYGRMIQGVTHEKPAPIADFVATLGQYEKELAGFDQFVLLLPDDMAEVAEMVDWKPTELFGRQVGARSFYETHYTHGAGISEGDRELFIGLGVANHRFGKDSNRRLNIATPEGMGPLGYMMAAYSMLGRIQRAKGNTLFQDHIIPYKMRASGWQTPDKAW
jgi:hypothetical protein